MIYKFFGDNRGKHGNEHVADGKSHANGGIELLV
jgi:hypothetical protein